MGGISEPRSLVSPRVVAEILNERGISPNRRLGQNFLVDPNILGIIIRAAGLNESDTVIEVGAGLGALTQVLTEECDTVFALESDPRLAQVLTDELGDRGNLVILNQDATRFDLDRLGVERLPGVKMVSNLPYNIAASLLIDCLKKYRWLTEYTVMVQREVADRILASPGGKEYSAATVKVRSRASVERVANVSRNCFLPPPRVDSTVIRLKRSDPALFKPEEGEMFDRVVSAAFSQRRKKLVNSIASGAGAALKESVREALVGVAAPGSRAEDLSPEQFLELVRALQRPDDPGLAGKR